MGVSGWGALSEGGGSPSVLHKVDVPGMTNFRCNSYYSGITSSMLCAGQASGGIDSVRVIVEVLSHTQVLERHIWSVLFLGAKDVLDQINQGFTLESPPPLVGSLGRCLRLVDE